MFRSEAREFKFFSASLLAVIVLLGAGAAMANSVGAVFGTYSGPHNNGMEGPISGVTAAYWISAATAHSGQLNQAVGWESLTISDTDATARSLFSLPFTVNFRVTCLAVQGYHAALLGKVVSVQDTIVGRTHVGDTIAQEIIAIPGSPAQSRQEDLNVDSIPIPTSNCNVDTVAATLNLGIPFGTTFGTATGGQLFVVP